MQFVIFLMLYYAYGAKKFSTKLNIYWRFALLKEEGMSIDSLETSTISS